MDSQMSERTGKTPSCLAITEKKPRRPACVGIFFQFFDWNSRFAKKKLFSRKLLPPARSKQATKNFGEDEKMPKNKPHLIADENSGGFPNVKKKGNRSDSPEQKHEMRVAGLVARLMGLESLPTVHRDNHKKASTSASSDVKDEFVNNHSGSDREVLNLDKGCSKVDSRPQKLQKTGQFERRAVTRFGAEALQIRNVLSRSRKHHHSKLASQVKSPRISSSRNVSKASRLIDAATRILEPGLQATNRAKCALTYSNSMNYVPRNKVLVDGVGLGVMLSDFVKQQDNDVGKSLMGHTPCKNCRNLLEVVDSVPTVEEQAFVSPSSPANMSFQGFERIKPRPTVSSLEREGHEVYQRNPVVLSCAAERLDNKQTCDEPILDGNPVTMEDQVQQHRFQKNEPSSIAFQQRTDTLKEMSVSRSRTPPKAKLNNLQSRRASSAANAITGAKDFVALNRSLNSCTPPRASSKEDNCMTDTERKFCGRRDDSLSQLRTPVRKRRTVSVNAQLESTGLFNSTPMRQKNIKCDLVSGKKLEPNARIADRACIKGRSANQGKSNKANANKDNDVVSFTFNSPLRHVNFISACLNDTSDHIDKNAYSQRGVISEENDGKTSLQRQMGMSGDSLGALLELKLKELTSQEEDELAIGGAAPKISTAMILQELVSALTAQQPFSPNCHMFNSEKTFQTGGRLGGTSVGFSHDGDHLSPGSVLEASFSNDSCFSSSLDDSSGRRLLYDSMDYSCGQLQLIETDADLLDSATSVNEGNAASKMVTDLLNHICRTLQSMDLSGGGLMSCRFNYAKDVILNAELLFRSAALRNSSRMKSFLISPFLFDELETLADALRINFYWLIGFEEGKEDSKDGSRVKRFLFDFVIEYLDSKYGQFCNCGFKAWRRAPLCLNVKLLIEEVGNEVRRWTNLAGAGPDEIMEWEMSHSLGKWTNFEIEEFETGAEIDWDILQVLVDEIVMELWECRLGSC